MAHYSISELRRFSASKWKYINHNRTNEAYAALAKKEKQAIVDKTNKAINDIDLKVDSIFFKKTGRTIHIVSIIVAAILFIGVFTFFRPALSFSFNDVLAAYDSAIEKDPNIIAPGMRDEYEIANGLKNGYYSESRIEEAKEEYLEWRLNECELMVAGTMFWVAVIHGILAFVSTVGSAKRTNPMHGIVIFQICLTVFYVLCWIVFTCRGAWGDVKGLFDAIGAILNVILMLFVSPFGAFIFFGTVGYIMAVPALFVPVVLVLGYVAYSVFLTMFVKANSGSHPTSKEAADLLTKKKNIIANCPKQAEEVYRQIMAKVVKPNPYASDYNAIPADVRDSVDELLGAIDSGYARDYVEAKRFLLDQKNHRELMAQRERHHKESIRQSAELQRSIDANTAAIRENTNKAVDVYIYY